ncbi:MAG: STAS domain-containing protein [Methylococcaceae bacterium]|nr:STAS domain-containing protein [Methylococcaceae bacterium]
MDIRITGSGKKGSIVIDGDMNIYNAVDLKESFVGALRTYEELEVNLAAVTQIDTTGIQLLVLLKREAGKLGRVLRLTNHSSVTLQAFDTYHITAFFGDPVVIPSE